MSTGAMEKDRALEQTFNKIGEGKNDLGVHKEDTR